jgi:hypothetical protein
MVCCLRGVISKSTFAKSMLRFGQSKLAARVDATKLVDLRTDWLGGASEGKRGSLEWT